MVKIRLLAESDIQQIVTNFKKNNWPKPPSTFETYLKEQELGERIAWIAFYQNKFAGYITLKWCSQYRPFQDKNIPEIMDFNVLPNMRCRGIGSKLLKIAEKAAARKSNTVDFLLCARRDKSAALAFFRKAFRENNLPEKVVIDKSGSNTAALDDLNTEISEDYGFSNKISK